jgi:hypothetical protein
MLNTFNLFLFFQPYVICEATQKAVFPESHMDPLPEIIFLYNLLKNWSRGNCSVQTYTHTHTHTQALEVSKLPLL